MKKLYFGKKEAFDRSEALWRKVCFFTVILHSIFLLFFFKGSVGPILIRPSKPIVVRNFFLEEKTQSQFLEKELSNNQVQEKKVLSREEKSPQKEETLKVQERVLAPRTSRPILPKEIPRKALPKETSRTASRETFSKERKKPPSQSKERDIARKAFAAKPAPSSIKKTPSTSVSRKEKKEFKYPSADLSKKWIEELQQSIAKITQEEHSFIQENAKESIKVPRKFFSLNIDSEEGEVSSKNEQKEEIPLLLIQELKSRLSLPSYGATKVRFSISLEGKIERLEFLQTESEENKRYLEKALQTLSFPWWKGSFPEKKSSSFTILFRNE